jgi:hypothetical protein
LGKLTGGTPMTKRNLPQPFGVDKIHFRDCFIGPSLRHFVGSNLQKTVPLFTSEPGFLKMAKL